MKLNTLILVILICVLMAVAAIYHEQLWLYVSTLFCLLQSEGMGCGLSSP